MTTRADDQPDTLTASPTPSDVLTPFRRDAAESGVTDEELAVLV